jgi:hypothetical protein
MHTPHASVPPISYGRTARLGGSSDPDEVAHPLVRGLALRTIVSELVTNTIAHAPDGYAAPPRVSPLTLLGVQAEARWVLLAVRDPWPGLPRTRTVGALEENGRGLPLVDELAASRWTQVHEPGGKTVYALVLRPGAELVLGERERLQGS